VEDKAFISIFGFLFIFGDIEFQINVFWMKGGVAFFCGVMKLVLLSLKYIKYKIEILLFSLEKRKIPVAFLRFFNVLLRAMMMIAIKAVQILQT
jgi:hypothetical protein